MVDATVDKTAGDQQKLAASSAVFLLSAVRANITGLSPHDDGKKVSQSRARQLFPSVSATALQQRCRTTLCNWRFHNDVKNIDFNSDEESVEAQCRAVLQKHPNPASNTFLLEPEHRSLVSRVQAALSADGSEKESLKDWRTLSTWARDAALNDGSGIVFPPKWVNSVDSFKFANFFIIMNVDVSLIPRGFMDGAPPGAIRGQWVPKNSTGEKKSSAPALVYTPEAAAKAPKDKPHAKSKHLNDAAIVDLVLTKHCFNFSTFEGPTDPVVPEDLQEGTPNDGERQKRRSPCPSDQEDEEQKDHEPEKRARSDTEEADLCTAITVNLFLADRDAEKGPCSISAEKETPENIVCSVLDENKVPETPAPSAAAVKDSAIQAGRDSVPNQKGAKSQVISAPAGKTAEAKTPSVAAGKQPAKPASAAAAEESSENAARPRTEARDTEMRDVSAAEDNDTDMKDSPAPAQNDTAPKASNKSGTTPKPLPAAPAARSSLKSKHTDKKEGVSPAQRENEPPPDKPSPPQKGPIPAKDLIKPPAAKKAKKQMSLFSFAKKSSPSLPQPNSSEPFTERTNNVAAATAK